MILSVVLIIMRFTGDQGNIDNSNNENIPANTNTANVNTEPVNNNTPQNINNNADSNTNYSNSNANNSGNTNTSLSSGEASLRAIARSFAERFGTYSNHSDYENIEHLLPYMTNQMKKWAVGFIEDQRSEGAYAGIYTGTTTKAMSVTTRSYSEDENEAEFLVSTQRKESTGSTSNSRIFYQDIQIKFLKEQSVWKVDQAWWR